MFEHKVFSKDGIKHLKHDIAPLLYSRVRYRKKYEFDVQNLFDRIAQLETMYCSETEYIKFYDELKADITFFMMTYNVSAPQNDIEYQKLVGRIKALLEKHNAHPRCMEWEKRLNELSQVDLHSLYIKRILEEEGEMLYKLYVEIDDTIPL